MENSAPIPAIAEEDFHRLRALLLGADYETLFDLQKCMNDPELFRDRVSSVLAEAIAHRNEKDDAIGKAFSPVIEASLTESISVRPQNITQVLYPVIGSTIRKSVTQTMSQSLESLNRAMQDSLSLKSIKWRLDAWRTGRSYAEVAMLNSLDYEVEQVFFLHRETSLLLQHVVSDKVEAKDGDMVSGMLSAINGFVSDSFAVSEDDGLDNLRVGELSVCIETGPHGILAAVVRGTVPEELRTRLCETLEQLHATKREQLQSFSGKLQPFEDTQPALNACLMSKSKSDDDGQKKKPWAAIGLLVVVALLLMFWAWKRHETRNIWFQSLRSLESEPGYVIVSSSPENGPYEIRGLKDPHARIPEDVIGQDALTRLDIDWKLQPYYSADDAFVSQRVRSLIPIPSGVSFRLDGTSARFSGRAIQTWFDRIKPLALSVTGVDQVDANNLQIEPPIAAALEPALDTEIARLTRNIESTVFYFDSDQDLPNANSLHKIPILTENLETLSSLSARDDLRLEVRAVGYSNSQSTEISNLELSQRSANRIIALIELNSDQELNLYSFGSGSRGLETHNNVRRVVLDITLTKMDF